MLSTERRHEAAVTLLRLAGRDHHDAAAIRHALELATFRKRLYEAASARIDRERDDLLRALNDLNPRATT